MARAVRGFVLVLLSALAACGGGGTESTLTPPASTLALSFGYKQFQFTWAAVDGAIFYRVRENPDGVSGYTQVSGDLATTFYNHDIVSLFQRLNASYLVHACNSAGCTASTPISIAANLPTALGAYVKPSNTGQDDQFGASVVLSADGNTLAVGARFEDS